MNKAKQWLIANDYINPDYKDFDNCIVEMKFKELYEIIELYALQHQLAEYKEEINKIFKQQ